MSVIPKSRLMTISPDESSKPIRCSELWDQPISIPPSTTCFYNVELRQRSDTKVIEYEHLSYDDFIFNASSRLSLRQGEKYILKIVPIYRCYIRGGIQQTIEGAAKCLLVVTERKSVRVNVTDVPVLKKFPSGDSPNKRRDTASDVQMPVMPDGVFQMKKEFLLNESFEEARAQLHSASASTSTAQLHSASASISTAELQPQAEELCNGGNVSDASYEEEAGDNGVERLPEVCTLQLSPHHVTSASFEEARVSDYEKLGYLDTSGSVASFVLGGSRYQTQESFLSHYSFEESRYEYIKQLDTGDNKPRPIRSKGPKIKKTLRKTIK